MLDTLDIVFSTSSSSIILPVVGPSTGGVTRIDFKPEVPKVDYEAVAIQTFAPEPYLAKKPIPVNFEASDCGFIASFYDANIATSGETEQEAFSKLKSILLDIFEAFSSEPAELLGPEPMRQMAVLREFIQPIDSQK